MAALPPDRSFALEAKEELAHLWPRTRCDRRAEAAGLVRSCGTLELGAGGRLALVLHTDHGAVARKALRLLHDEFHMGTQVLVRRRERLRKNLVFSVRVPPQPGLVDMLVQMGVLDAGGNLREGLPPGLEGRECCARAFLRGFFLGAGWVSAPDRGHHLELVCPGAGLAVALAGLLASLGLGARTTVRKEQHVVYIKEGEQVARFLALVGAHRQVLRYEDVRAFKEIKNRINREINAETANVQKTLDAAGRQVAAIRRLAAQGLLERLPAPLRELAELRLQNPEASLAELGQMCRPPIGKSGANHRMRQILRWAAEIPPDGATQT